MESTLGTSAAAGGRDWFLISPSREKCSPSLIYTAAGGGCGQTWAAEQAAGQGLGQAAGQAVGQGEGQGVGQAAEEAAEHAAREAAGQTAVAHHTFHSSAGGAGSAACEGDCEAPGRVMLLLSSVAKPIPFSPDKSMAFVPRLN